MIRLAIYFTPRPDSEITRCATKWLGRDVFSANYLGQQPPAKMSVARFKELTSSPFHYGFHGTIKPPFRLTPNSSIEQVAARLRDFAKKEEPFILPDLHPCIMGRFLCLQPSKPCPQLYQLAEKTVRQFDDLRLMPGADELLKRRRSGLSLRQESILQRWGYPYLMEEFRFHLTLSDKIDDDNEREILCAHAKTVFTPRTCEKVMFDGLALFIEQNRAPLRLLNYFPLG